MNGNSISIKGTRDGLVIIFDTNQEYEVIKEHLLLKMESAKGFFKGAKFAFYNKEQIPTYQKRELEAICCNYGLVPASISPKKYFEKAKKRQDKPAACEVCGEKALLIHKNLRSGQNVTHSGNIVIAGNVHPGAEVAAGGNVIIMGSCYGHIHAGITGDENAKVIAFRLVPAIISIAGVLARSSKNNKTPNPYPEMAFLQNGKIILKKYRH